MPFGKAQSSRMMFCSLSDGPSDKIKGLDKPKCFGDGHKIINIYLKQPITAL
jgi:hypothetical protein